MRVAELFTPVKSFENFLPLRNKYKAIRTWSYRAATCSGVIFFEPVSELKISTLKNSGGLSIPIWDSQRLGYEKQDIFKFVPLRFGLTPSCNKPKSSFSSPVLHASKSLQS